MIRSIEIYESVDYSKAVFAINMLETLTTTASYMGTPSAEERLLTADFSQL